jgi:hypothetical protein
MSRPLSCLVLLLCACEVQHAAHSVSQGDSCNYDRDCAPVDGAVVDCPCGTCEKYFDLGFSCGADAVVCTATQTCSSLGGPEGGCIPDADLGGSCASTQCLPGLDCNQTTQTCVVPGALGAACDATDEDSCAKPTFCAGTTSTCAMPGGAGAACDWQRIYRNECVDGNACSLVTNTCVPILDNGASCTDDAGCTSGYCTPDQSCETRSC